MTTDPRKGKPSASSLYRLALCPASWLAEQRIPEPPASDDAALGTLLHKHMEDGTTPEDPEAAEAVAWCRAMEGHLAATYGTTGLMVREKRLWEVYGMFSGQPDNILFAPDFEKSALVVDYKFGRNAVEPPGENWQLFGLSLLALDNYPELEVVYATILQPFVSRDVPQVLEVTRSMQEAIRKRTRNVIEAARTSPADYQPGAHQCRYCRAIDSCPAIRQKVNAISTVNLKDWIDWSPERKAELYTMSRLAKKMAEKVEARVKEDLRAGNPIPGYTLAPGRTSFKVTDAQAAYCLLSERVGISAEDFAACCNVSISKVDKLVHATLKAQDIKYTTKQTSELVRGILASCGESSTTDGTIKEL